MLEHAVEECQCAGKFCRKCSQLVCCLLFASDRRRSEGGLQSACKTCNKAYRAVHHDRIQAYKAEYRREYSTELVEKQQIYYQNHLDQVRRYLQGYYQKTSGQQRVRRRLNYLSKREQILAQHATYKRMYPELVRLHGAVRSARKRHAGGTLTPQQWREIKGRYQYTCLCCKKKEPDIRLSIDHVIPICKGGKSDASNIQPLCRSCNSRKGTKIIDYRMEWTCEAEDIS